MKTLKISNSVARLAAQVLLLLCLCIDQGSRAETIVCGTISGQAWAKAASPFRVTCDVVVNSLTISEGVTVIFEGNYVFRVDGRLTATGTTNEPIIFTSTNCWQGIHFNGQIQPSRLSHCRIEAACNSGVRVINASPVIENCVITGNNANRGGGLFVQLTQNHAPTLASCSVSGNFSTDNGGGVYASLAVGTLTFSNCTISGNALNRNSAGNNAVGDFEGGGIFRETSGGTMVLDQCQVFNNTNRSRCTQATCDVIGLGGGIYSGGDLILRNCVFTNNRLFVSEESSFGSGESAQAYGGAVYQTGGNLSAANCLFVANVSDASSTVPTDRGSAIYLNSGIGTVVNCTIVLGNAGGPAIYRAGGTLAVTNSIIYYNDPVGLTYGAQVGGTVTIAYSDVQNGFAGAGNIALSPAFIQGTCRPYVLDPSISPCIDAGDPDPAYNDACSLGDFSLGNARNDMGAYGGPGACLWGACESCELSLSGPTSAAFCHGQNATFCVTAAGCEPIGYQWRFNGIPITDATNNCYTVSNVQSNNAGAYSVVVCNASGCQTNSATLVAYPACIDIHLYAGLTITGQTGHVYCVQYVNDLNSTNWISVTNFTYTGPEFFYLDRQSPFQPRRFYRVMEGPCEEPGITIGDPIP